MDVDSLCEVRNVKRFIYADNAATTQLDVSAFEKMKPYLLNEYGNVSQPYAFARAPKTALKEARKIIAECIGAMPEEIYFTSGGTESDNWAIKGSAFSGINKDEIITSSIEHHAILRACEDAEKLGYSVVYLPVDKQGAVQPQTLAGTIGKNTRLVSIMFSNNEIGTIQDISTLAQIAHDKGALFHTDAVQAVGHYPINVKELGVDMLSASAHKFNGPKGVGFLYVRSGTDISSYMSGGSQERGLRAGTENIASIVGMAHALKMNIQDLPVNMEHLRNLEACLLNLLTSEKVEFIRNGGRNIIPGNISLSFPGHNGESILHRLDLMGICVSTGSACDSKETQISHVLQAIQLPYSVALGTIRVSFGKNNTMQDAMCVGEALLKIVR